jgi:hypothetical protein
MAKIEVDADQLAAVVAQAVASALKALSEPTKPIEQPKPAKSVKKRGRPRKEKPRDEAIIDDEVKEILEFIPPIETKKDNTSLVKKRALPANTIAPRGDNEITKASVKTQSILDPNREIKFYDNKIIPADRCNYPEPGPRDRPAKEKMKFTCSFCHQEFEAYPSEFPQAFYKERIPGIGEGSPMIRCNVCNGSPPRAY